MSQLRLEISKIVKQHRGNENKVDQLVELFNDRLEEACLRVEVREETYWRNHYGFRNKLRRLFKR
jgi:hypothetical protein